MFSNYFKIALRSLLKAFNQSHKNYRHIGIAMVSETRDGKTGTSRITGVPLGTELKRSYKEDFKYVVPSTQLTDYILAMGDKEFIPQVIIAICLASPLTYYVMNKWLQNYEYRTGMPWWILAGAGVLSLVISVLTVSARTLRAALANPIQSLRNE